MKLLIPAALAAVLAAGSSFAQTQPESPPIAPSPELGTPPVDPEAEAEQDRPPADRSAEQMHHRMMRWHREMMRDDDRRGRRHWRGGRNRPDPGAHFRIEVAEDGSMKLDVKCAANEPTQSCADVLMDILDRLDVDSPPRPRDEETLPPQTEQ